MKWDNIKAELEMIGYIVLTFVAFYVLGLAIGWVVG